MSTYKNVLVLGASGNIGAPILSALLESKLFTVTALSRESSTATFPAGVRVVKTDFSEASLVAAFEGQDAVVSAIAGAAVGEQIKIVDAAAKAGVKRFITSDFGSDLTNPAVLAAVPIFAGKLEINEHLRTKEAGGLTWTSIVNGAFVEFGFATGFLGFDLKNRKATIYGSGDVPTSATTYGTVGKSVVAVLSKPAETANRYVHIASFTASQNEILAALEQATGDTFAVETKPAETLRDSGLEALKAGGGPAVANLILWGSYGEGNGGDYALRKNDNALLGLEEENLAEIVRRTVAAK